MSSLEGLDEVLTKLGIGPWNFLFFTVNFLVTAVLPTFLIGSEFMNPIPNFTCNVPNNTHTASYNGSECVMVEEERVQVPCTSWNYDTSVFHSTIAMEWDLVCGRALLIPLYQTIYTVGSLVGSILAAYAAHRFGRRWAVRVGALGTVLGMVVLLTTPWLYLLLASRFILGVTVSTMICPSFMLCMEVCVPRLRPTVGVVLALPYALMMILLSILAFFVRDWRTLHAAATFPFLLLFIPVLYLVDESPRWLLVHGRLQETVKVLQRGARLNKVMLPETTILTAIISPTSKGIVTTNDKSRREPDSRDMQVAVVESDENSQMRCAVIKLEHNLGYGSMETHKDGNKSNTTSKTFTNSLGAEDGLGSWWAGPVALVRSSSMRKITCLLVTIYFLQGIVYLGLPLSSSSFSSPFLYMALLGVVEVPAYSLTAPITKRLGRRTVISFCFFTCGILLLCLLVLDKIVLNVELVNLTMILLSYLLVCTSYQVSFVFAPELLPTTLRSWGTAACMVSSNMGYCVSPLITDYLAEDQPWIIMVVFSLCAVLAGMLVFLLPETNGQPLLETVADLRERLSHKKLSKTDKDDAIANSKF